MRTRTGGAGVDGATQEALRTEVRSVVAAAGGRRSIPARLSVGVPGADRHEVADDPTYDDGLRLDLVGRLLEARMLPTPCAWLTRPGDLSTRDGDLAWCRAALRAFADHGLALGGFYVVTRHGWRDLLTGQERTWARVRIR